MNKIEQLRERRNSITKSINKINSFKKKLPGKFPFRGIILKTTDNLDKRLHKSRAELSDNIQRLKQQEGTPNWLPGKWSEWWKNPYTVPLGANEAIEFKATLWNHGYLSPNFTRQEAMSKDGTPVPGVLAGKAQYHAFALERVRHRLGDKSMHPLSWYRSPSHNAAVGGVSNSQHLFAWATDWSDAERIRLSSAQFNVAMNEQFANGGRGTSQGNIRHVDNGPARTWVYG